MRRGQVSHLQLVAGWEQREFDVAENGQQRHGDLNLREVAGKAAMRSKAEGSERPRLLVLRPLRRVAFDVEVLRFRKQLRQAVRDGIPDDHARPGRHGVAAKLE